MADLRGTREARSHYFGQAKPIVFISAHRRLCYLTCPPPPLQKSWIRHCSVKAVSVRSSSLEESWLNIVFSVVLHPSRSITGSIIPEVYWSGCSHTEVISTSVWFAKLRECCTILRCLCGCIFWEQAYELSDGGGDRWPPAPAAHHTRARSPASAHCYGNLLALQLQPEHHHYLKQRI